MDLVLDGDVTSLSDLLADIGNEADNNVNNQSKKEEFPLPESHWINQPYGTKVGFKTLLHLALEQKNPELVKLLLRAGARADSYNDILGVAPIHTAINAGSLDLLKILLDCEPANQASAHTIDKVN